MPKFLSRLPGATVRKANPADCCAETSHTSIIKVQGASVVIFIGFQMIHAHAQDLALPGRKHSHTGHGNGWLENQMVVSKFGNRGWRANPGTGGGEQIREPGVASKSGKRGWRANPGTGGGEQIRETGVASKTDLLLGAWVASSSVKCSPPTRVKVLNLILFYGTLPHPSSLV